MAAEDSQNESDVKEHSLDSQGKLHVSRDFGAKNAGRRVRLSIDLLPPESEFRGSRKHILDLLDRPAWVKQLNDLIAVEEITLSDDPCPVPSGHQAVAETDLAAC